MSQIPAYIPALAGDRSSPPLPPPSPAPLTPAPASTPAPTPASPVSPAAPSAADAPLSNQRSQGSEQGSLTPPKRTEADEAAQQPELMKQGDETKHSPLPQPEDARKAGNGSGMGNGSGAGAKGGAEVQQKKQSSLLGATLGYSLDTVTKVTGVPVPSVLSDVGFKAVGLVDGTASAAVSAVEQVASVAVTTASKPR